MFKFSCFHSQSQPVKFTGWKKRFQLLRRPCRKNLADIPQLCAGTMIVCDRDLKPSRNISSDGPLKRPSINCAPKKAKTGLHHKNHGQGNRNTEQSLQQNLFSTYIPGCLHVK